MRVPNVANGLFVPEGQALPRHEVRCESTSPKDPSRRVTLGSAYSAPEGRGCADRSRSLLLLRQVIPYPTGRFLRRTLFQALRARLRSVLSLRDEYWQTGFVSSSYGAREQRPSGQTFGNKIPPLASRHSTMGRPSPFGTRIPLGVSQTG